jgi:hypothetical protein
LVPQERPIDIQPQGVLVFDFRVSPAARVRGRVLLPPGLSPTPRLFLLPGLGSRTSNDLAFPFHLDGVYANVPVAADGSFELDGLPVGSELSVIATHPHFPMTHPVPVRIRQPGLQRRTLILQPLMDGLLTGTVSDPTQKPIADAQLRIRPRRAVGSSWPELRALLDELTLNLRSLDQHVIAGQLLRLDGTSGMSDAQGFYALGRPQHARDLELVVSAEG